MQVKELKESEINFDKNGEKKFEKGEDSKPLTVKKAEISEKGIDVSGKSVEFPLLEGGAAEEEEVEELYVYKNQLNLIPRAVSGLRKLKTLKFFANEVNLFADGGGFRDLIELECLQLKVSAAPGLKGLELGKLKALKELELSKVPSRPSAFPILSEIAGLKCLTKLSVCHFSIRYLPPEIGFLSNLEHLDLSFNKMRNLPTELTRLNSLISLKVSNNKLVELPPGLSALQRLENLDLSNNRLTSLGSLELGLMHNLQRLNLQCNRLLTYCQIPSWISCYLEGNGKDMSNDEFISSSVEMDVLESSVEESCVTPQYGSSISSSQLSVPSSSNRSYAARKSKGWKRRYYLQQRARQERLNSSRRRRGETQGTSEKCKACKSFCSDNVAVPADSLALPSSKVTDEEFFSQGAEFEKPLVHTKAVNASSKKDFYVEKCSCEESDSLAPCKEQENDCSVCDESLEFISNDDATVDEGSSSEVVSSISKAKRHSDGDLDNPKPSKYRRPTNKYSNLSCKYSKISMCGIDDHLADGFYDAGRDRPFMPLQNYEQNLHLDSREVILVDREQDEKLDAITLRAQALVLFFKQMSGSTKSREHPAIDDLQIASLLALFVSDHFGGSDKSALIQQTRKTVSVSNYRNPFLCTCPTGNADSVIEGANLGLGSVEDIVFRDLCERSLQSIKARRKSTVVPIGSLQFGICRHRALLMKYLCDRMEPQIPCELVRGYLDFSPHAWNVIVVKRNQSWVRMIVDACHPHDIREETDPEYFCRYIPLSRINVHVPDGNPGPSCSFPSISLSDKNGKAASSTVRCNFGSLDTAAKVRSLEVRGASPDEIRNFEYNCLGEVRMLSVLKHPCIVELYGHQISSRWVPSSDGNSEQRILQSTILMEYVNGGSLKGYLEELSRAGNKCVPVQLALNIIRDVACALRELHSRHIIHRDIKSENIVVDLDKKRADGAPVVKLCDFDRAVPLRSYLHTCCIAHLGIPPPDICVGTPRWMAPEVFLTMHNRSAYGLEVDIWSFGCLLLELLTLQFPYAGIPESDIPNFLQTGRRPPLTKELEAFVQPDKELDELIFPKCSTDVDGPETESETLRFLVNVYHRCTMKNPTDRPTAEKLYDMLLAYATSTSARELEEE